MSQLLSVVHVGVCGFNVCVNAVSVAVCVNICFCNGVFVLEKGNATILH